ncbi:MAG TPA: hypothetical protein VHX14_19460, partial [Thermoanaerobaculia bacterium]|nr:hypothetical protein [Thermoanaerobaculia bacterium]
LRSRTSGFFLDVDRAKDDNHHFIAVRLTNDGGRSAQVDNARIEFTKTGSGPSKVLASDLDIVNRGSMIVPAGGSVDLTLYGENLTFVGAPTDDSNLKDKYKQQVAEDLCSTIAVLTINVHERDRLNRLENPQPVTMPMTKDAMQSWVLERTTGKQPKDTCP